jgi:transcriptional regulator with XRE-family HTH domain
MERGNEWTKRVAAQVGKRVAYFRKRTTGERGRKLTVQDLSRRTGKHGLALSRPTISKLEQGLRQSVTVDEVMVLAKALSVSPLDLIFPVGKAETAEVLPGQYMDTFEAVRWFSGFSAQPGNPPDDDKGVIHLYQLHDVIVRDWPVDMLRPPYTEEQHEAWAKAAEARQRIAVAALRTVRQEMRGLGLIPPPLDTLAWVEGEAAG